MGPKQRFQALYPLWYLCASVYNRQTVKRLPAMRETGVRSLGWEDAWRRKWQPTPVLLPRKFHGWRILVGYSPWGHKESDTTERIHDFTIYNRKSFVPLFSLKQESVAKYKWESRVEGPFQRGNYTVCYIAQSGLGIFSQVPLVWMNFSRYAALSTPGGNRREGRKDAGT